MAGDAMELPFTSHSFDVVTCGLSFSHFPDVAAALRGVRRILRSGGRLIISAWGVEKENPAYSAAAEVRERSSSFYPPHWPISGETPSAEEMPA